MSEREKEERLQKLLKGVVEKDQASLRAVQSEVDALQAQIDALSQQAYAGTDVDFFMSSRMELHQNWTAREKKRLSVLLAQKMAQKGDAIAALQKSFGREQAFSAVIKARRAERSR